MRRLLDGLRATPEQRLAWLEEAIALAHATGALPRKNRPGESDADPGGSRSSTRS